MADSSSYDRMASMLGKLIGQCHEIFDLFFEHRTLPEPHMNRQKQFRELLVLAKIFDYKVESSNSCVRVVNTTKQANNFFSLKSLTIFIFLKYSYFICKHTQVLYFG